MKDEILEQIKIARNQSDFTQMDWNFWKWFLTKEKFEEHVSWPIINIDENTTLLLSFPEQMELSGTIFSSWHSFQTIINNYYRDNWIKWLKVSINNINTVFLGLIYHNPQYHNIFSPSPYLQYSEAWLFPAIYYFSGAESGYCFYFVKHNDTLMKMINDNLLENCNIVPLIMKNNYPELIYDWNVSPNNVEEPVVLKFETF